jgi:hypothetical protein
MQGISIFSFAGDRRRGNSDRRGTPRGGRRVSDKIRLALFTAACTLAFTNAAKAATGPAPMKFGFDVNSAKHARELGMPVAYGSLWVGAWNQPEKYGWGGIKDQLQTAKASGVTPIVLWWYWGDDISPSCVENGCQDRYENVHKDKATWYRMTNELADLIVNVMGPDSGTIVVVENEFNQGGIGTYKPFDGYLVDQINALHQRKLTAAIEFGNWDRQYWKNFSGAAAAADVLGAMALESSLRDATTYLSGADGLLDMARYYKAAFNKPVMITDVGFSSYPEPSYLNDQDTVVRDIFSRVDEFRAAGVQGLVWRMLTDDPKFDTSNYHGEAERHWGLLHADGSAKPAFQPFLNGMLTEKAFADAMAAEAAAEAEAAAAAAAAQQAAAVQQTQQQKTAATAPAVPVPSRSRGGSGLVGRAVPRATN